MARPAAALYVARPPKYPLSATMRCPSCGTENEPGRKFCGECGAALARACAVCEAANGPGAKFCGECGAPLSDAAAAEPSAAEHVAERRLVSVLFADLVGFTPLSESRDAEDVRDLLTRYFETASRTIERYGGSVEKFIGDAVMAVWGTPVTREDDAERAVRAALELTTAVQALGIELGLPELRARAGVLTGEAAVTLGARDQGMVAGDLVNVASRIQSVAPAGAVLVGEVTRRATEPSIVYEDAGTHELKGKAEAMPLWRALRVVALVGGALKSAGLEAPFVGREREFQLVKDLFHASADQGRAHLVSVWGIGGIGKSRLSWEFLKYMDGLAQVIYWHRGRCLPYGEGVTYWALADMVRSRAGIAEGEDPASASAKLHASVAEHVPEAEEQRWVEPRLAHLLGLEERSTREPEELFSAWRLFFERLADRNPVVMVFEDLQWADAALVDFITYLLEWSRNHPLFVITLARPELQDRHPTWGAARRNLTSLSLEPLEPDDMRALLNGLAPGLPGDVQASILERSEGVPLYAVETVRMLIDRSLLVADGAGYRPTGPIDALEVPESLHALIAARLDGLDPSERRLVQHAAVLGKTFTTDALASLAGLPPREVEGMLSSLARKEILGLQNDLRSPEHGQYGFLQELVKRVAYETLSKRDRKALHVAAARHLQEAYATAEDDVVEIVAFHYAEAYRAAPDAPDAPELRASARVALVRAGERAASLAARDEAQRYFDAAFDLADEATEQGAIAERAGEMAAAATRHSQSAARVSARLGELLWLQFTKLDEAVELLERALSVLTDAAPDEGIAALMAQAGRFHYFRGELDLSSHWIERALDAAEAGLYYEVLSQALNTKSLILRARGRIQEGLALLQYALAIALEQDLPDAISRARFNLANEYMTQDLHEEALEQDLRNVELVRLIGKRDLEVLGQIHLVFDYTALGRWDEVEGLLEEFPLQEDPNADPIRAIIQTAGLVTLANRGKLDRLEPILEAQRAVSDPSDIQDGMWSQFSTALVRQAQGRLAEAQEAAEAAFAYRDALSLPALAFPLMVAFECAFELGRVDRADELLRIAESAPPGQSSAFLRGHVARIRGRMALAEGRHEETRRRLEESGAIFRAIKMPFWAALADLQLAESLLAAGDGAAAEGRLRDAEETFVRLKAEPWLRRVEATRAAMGTAVVPA
ncbi:MAG: zinc-ribbon domain-containing protein [Actinobacteria bacterium]|nr:MAG: zinc-ribbon domain-containing protein [Actinomycetota bacterium]